MEDLIKKIAVKTAMAPDIIKSIIALLDEGNTVPFIARYRKEMTHGATDEQLRDFNDIYMYTKHLELRKLDVIRLIDEKWLLTEELRKQIMEADTLARVEDLYRPFKEKKNTKATIAKAKWLEPLGKILAKAELTKEEFEAEAEKYVKDTWDEKTSVKDVKEAIQWAKDIVAEDVSDHADLRAEIKDYEQTNALLATKATKKFEENGVYKIYKEYTKKISEMPSYAYLAVSRAENEKQLSIKINMSEARITESAEKFFVPAKANTCVEYLKEAIQDGLDRLLLPSLEREIRSDKKHRADEAAIKVFGDNMKHLLLTGPVKGLTVLGFDPAFRTGCKLAIVDKTGKFLYNTVIYPTEPQKKTEESEKVLKDLIDKFKVDLIVIGNGTASRESEKFVSDFIKKFNPANGNSGAGLPVKYMITSESWASVYSASELAQEEYPNLDVTVRGAISIAHRVQDPLAELTKIDPKAIGVGQYQHDVDQKFLKEKLDEKVQDTVNSVWVDVNTASYTLLQYIAWLTPALAKNVVIYRNENGEFDSKSQIKKVKGVGPKAFEQAVGFLRIKWGKDPLDGTGIHPEIHKQVYELLEKEFSLKKKDVKLPMVVGDVSKKINDRSEKYGIWKETLKDVLAELERPGLDPRDDVEPPSFKSDVLDFKDLQMGMELDGVVRNVTDFWAFVDIGLHNDGLVHKSQMANFYVNNPIDVVSVGMKVKVKVIGIEPEREKVSLTMKTGDPANWNSRAGAVVQKPKDAGPRKEFRRVESGDEDTGDYSSGSIKSNITFS